jgi:uncharacterized protein YbjQ (UPF0145 family)
MLVSTTDTIEGARIVKYIGVVTGEAIIGANFLRDFLANITDVIGGRSGAYERSLREGKQIAIDEMVSEAQQRGGNAVIGISLDYESIPLGTEKGTLLLVAATGTAVVIQ